MHGFDDQGAQFDAEGQLRQLVDRGRPQEAFEARTAKLVKQFDDYVAIDDLHVKGKLTLGENIADLGGLTVAYDALQKALADAGKSPTRRSTATPRTSASSSTGRRCGAATSRRKSSRCA